MDRMSNDRIWDEAGTGVGPEGGTEGGQMEYLGIPRCPISWEVISFNCHVERI